ncbi:unnamed protein product [Rhizopus stolonifer]
MPRASKSYCYEAVRVLNKSSGTMMRNESTTTTTKKGELFGKFLGATVVLGVGYRGAIFHSLNDPKLRETFTEYISGTKETVQCVDNLYKNYNMDKYRDQTSDWKRQSDDLANKAKGIHTKIQEFTNEYVSDVYESLSGQKRTLADKVVERPSSSLSTATDTVTNTTLSSDKRARDYLVEKSKSIVMKEVQSVHKVVYELSQIVVKLTSTLNQSGLPRFGKDIIKEAETKIKMLNARFLVIDKEHEKILKSLQSVQERGGRVEGSMAGFRMKTLKSLNQHMQKLPQPLLLVKLN